jgi:glycine/D-amino acid oxidase-like deaminating enzyme
VREEFGIECPGAILSAVAATVDPFLLTHRLLEHGEKKGMQVFDRTTISSWKKVSRGMELTTDRHAVIRARTMIFACGYEAQTYLRERIVSLKSTYAFVTAPDQPQWWKQDAMVWESARPYLYLRRTIDGRILVGGEDDAFRSPLRRDARLEYKTKRLITRMQSMFPDRLVESEYAWAGTFGETKDGLGFIGPSPEVPNAYFALGFGGNGITFSVIAANILRDLVCGKKNDDAELFRFGR